MPEGCLWLSKWDTSYSFLPVLQRVPLALRLSLNRCSRVPKSFAYVFYHFHMLSSSILIFFSEALKSTSFSHFSHCYNKKTQQSILQKERSTLAQVHHGDGNQRQLLAIYQRSAVITAAAWFIFCVHTFVQVQIEPWASHMLSIYHHWTLIPQLSECYWRSGSHCVAWNSVCLHSLSWPQNHNHVLVSQVLRFRHEPQHIIRVHVFLFLSDRVSDSQGQSVPNWVCSRGYPTNPNPLGSTSQEQELEVCATWHREF